jgi:hypothetical protein
MSGIADLEHIELHHDIFSRDLQTLCFHPIVTTPQISLTFELIDRPKAGLSVSFSQSYELNLCPIIFVAGCSFVSAI